MPMIIPPPRRSLYESEEAWIEALKEYRGQIAQYVNHGPDDWLLGPIHRAISWLFFRTKEPEDGE